MKNILVGEVNGARIAAVYSLNPKTLDSAAAVFDDYLGIRKTQRKDHWVVAALGVDAPHDIGPYLGGEVSQINITQDEVIRHLGKDAADAVLKQSEPEVTEA
jgi:hypothetical protein